jgi:hypothetical protein
MLVHHRAIPWRRENVKIFEKKKNCSDDAKKG